MTTLDATTGNVTRPMRCGPPRGRLVSNGDVVSVVDAETGEPVDRSPELHRSISGLFGEIRDALSMGGSVEVTYDETYGHPVQAWLDPRLEIGDDEYGFTLERLEPIP